MAIISEEELTRRINHEGNLLNILGIGNGNGSHPVKESHQIELDPQPAQVEHKKIHNGGRRPGDNNIPDPIRILAGVLAHTDTAKNVADALGISPIQVHHLKHGRHGHDIESPALKKNIQSKLETVRENAVDRLMESMNVIEAGLPKVKRASTAAGIARQLATVIEKTGDKKPEAQNVTFQIYAPQVRSEEKFDIIEVERNQE